MVLQLLFTVAFSAVPLTLYVPPVRSLNLFVETIEDLVRESRTYTHHLYPRVRHVWLRMLDCLLVSSSSSSSTRTTIAATNSTTAAVAATA